MNMFKRHSVMKKVEKGIMTPNEARSMLGLDPLSKDGGELVIQHISQAEYDALEQLDPNTLYFIEGDTAVSDDWCRVDTKKTNCPNCGAPLPRDGYCEYCGTYAN
jgi:hypothetical protein